MNATTVASSLLIDFSNATIGTSFNDTASGYEDDDGETLERPALSTVIPMTILYALILVTGVFGKRISVKRVPIINLLVRSIR